MRCHHLITRSMCFLPWQFSLRQLWCYQTASTLVFPGTSIPIIACVIIILFSIHAHTTSTYGPARSWIFLPPPLSLRVLSFFILSFLTMSSLLTPLIHLNILVSATSNFSSWRCLQCPCLDTVQYCRSYIVTLETSHDVLNGLDTA